MKTLLWAVWKDTKSHQLVPAGGNDPNVYVQLKHQILVCLTCMNFNKQQESSTDIRQFLKNMGASR